MSEGLDHESYTEKPIPILSVLQAKCRNQLVTLVPRGSDQKGQSFTLTVRGHNLWQLGNMDLKLARKHVCYNSCVVTHAHSSNVTQLLVSFTTDQPASHRVGNKEFQQGVAWITQECCNLITTGISYIATHEHKVSGGHTLLHSATRGNLWAHSVHSAAWDLCCSWTNKTSHWNEYN